MLRNLSDMQTHMHHLLEHQDTAEQTSSLKAIAEIEQRTFTALDTYQATHAARRILSCTVCCNSTGEATWPIRKAKRSSPSSMGECLTRSAEDLEAATRQRAKNLLNAEPAYEQTATKTADAIASLLELHRKIDAEMKIEGDRLVEQARLIVIGVVSLLGLLIVSIYLMMKRLVAAPLKRLAATADRVARHDLTAEFEPWPTGDEVGILANSLTTMLANLRERGTALMRKTKELEAFTYSIAHDLKGPLREIEGFLVALGKAI